MDLTNGAKALVSVHNKERICSDSNQIYDFLMNNGIKHQYAVNAQIWAELAYADEIYSTKEFQICIQ